MNDSLLVETLNRIMCSSCGRTRENDRYDLCYICREEKNNFDFTLDHRDEHLYFEPTCLECVSCKEEQNDTYEQEATGN